MSRILKDYLAILVGSFITAIGLNFFLIPNKIAAGGVSGLATVLYYLFNWPVGITMLAFNIPLFIVSTRVLGGSFGIRTLFGAVSLSVIVDLLPISPLTDTTLLATVYGGIIAGVGIGLVFRYQGTTGGTDLVARLLSHFTPLTNGQGLLLADFAVITLSGIVFSPELALWALLALFLTSRLIDLVQEGFGTAKALFIITNSPEEIGEAIMTRIGRGVTSLRATGMYTKAERPMLLCVVARSELTNIKRLVHDMDSRAFIIVADVTEVLGEGFKMP